MPFKSMTGMIWSMSVHSASFRILFWVMSSPILILGISNSVSKMLCPIIWLEESYCITDAHNRQCLILVNWDVFKYADWIIPVQQISLICSDILECCCSLSFITRITGWFIRCDFFMYLPCSPYQHTGILIIAASMYIFTHFTKHDDVWIGFCNNII